MRRVLHLRSSGGLLGAESVIVQLAKNSCQFGYQSVVGSLGGYNRPESELLEVAQQQGVETKRFETADWNGWEFFWKIRSYVKNHRIDLLHCHGYKEDFYGLFAFSGVPIVATNHLWKIASLKSKIYRRIDVEVLKRVDRVVGVSRDIVSEMKDLGISYCEFVANGIDTAHFFPKPKSKRLLEECNIDNETFIFGMISSLTEEKNHVFVLNALSAVQGNFVLLIVGDGPLKQQLRQKVQALGLASKVSFLGKRRDIEELHSIINVYLLPSKAEGMPISLLEAMSCGKAVIASAVGENNHIINHMENGLLLSPTDFRQLVNYMNMLVHDKSLVERLGYNARTTVENNFSSQGMTKNYCKIYDSLFGHHLEI
jgi:glycosyltransferase involved in cell wall biosynthesis